MSQKPPRKRSQTLAKVKQDEEPPTVEERPVAPQRRGRRGSKSAVSESPHCILRCRGFSKEEQTAAAKADMPLSKCHVLRFSEENPLEVVIDSSKLESKGLPSEFGFENEETVSFEFPVVLNGIRDDAADVDLKMNQTADAIAKSVLSGVNTFAASFGCAGTGRSRSMFGFGDEEGLISCVLRHLGEQIQLHNSNGKANGRSVELNASFYEIYQERFNDLFDDRSASTPLHSRFRAHTVRWHPMLGHYVDGVTQFSVPDANASLLRAKIKKATQHHDLHSQCTSILCLDVRQSEVIEGSDGESVTVVRMSRLCLSDVAAVPRGHFHAKESRQTPAGVTALAKVLASQGMKHKRDSIFTTLFSDAFAATARCYLIANVSPHVAHADDTFYILYLLQCASRVCNHVEVNGGSTSHVLLDMRAEIERLQKLLESSPDHSDKTLTTQVEDKSKIETEIQERKIALEDIEQHDEKTKARFRALQKALDDQLAKTQELQRNNADAQLRAEENAVMLTAEKQKAFAQAFRGAFLVGKQMQELRQTESDLAAQIRHHREKHEKLNQQFTAVKGERDRFQYENLRLDKETKRLRAEVNVLTTRNNKLNKEVCEHQDKCEALQTKLNLARFEATAELHELRTQMLQVERSRDSLEYNLEVKEKEIVTLKRQMEDKTRDVRAEGDEKLRTLRQELSDEQAKNQTLRRLLERKEADNDELNDRIAERRAENEAKDSLLEGAKERADQAIKAANARVTKMHDAHSIERESYLQLLDEGRNAVAELRRVEAFFLTNQQSSIYRSGKSGVHGWLAMHALERYASAFDNQGFSDLVSVANIEERDLLEMKIISGHRKKIVAAASDLKKEMHRLKIEQDKKRAQNPTTAKSLLDDLYSWIGDFEASIKVEHQAAARRLDKD